MSKIIPKEWEIPEEFFEVNMPISDNPTINYCDAIKRNAKLLQEKFRGNSQPAYVKHSRRNLSINAFGAKQTPSMRMAMKWQESYDKKDSGEGPGSTY